MVKEIVVKSTPASRWAFRYGRRYGYTLYGSLIFIGLIALLFGGSGIVIGITLIIIGGFLIRRHNNYHKKLKNKE